MIGPWTPVGTRPASRVWWLVAVAGLGYALVVLAAPLGLWLLGVRTAVAWAFGGRSYALNLSAYAVVFALVVTTVVRRRPFTLTRRQVVAAAVAGLALAGWSLVGFAHHGAAQTLVGVRIVLFPVAALVVTAALPVRDIRRLLTVLAWLVVANALAAVGEVAVGPVRLAAWGFDSDRAIRYIDGTFRAPGLADFNASLGMLAGAYLLGYLALWLTRVARPRHWSWHAGARVRHSKR